MVTDFKAIKASLKILFNLLSRQFLLPFFAFLEEASLFLPLLANATVQ